jgi:two-component sensor histidine kinase
MDKPAESFSTRVQADAGVVAIARRLAELDGLHDPIYLCLDKRTSTLEARPLGEGPAPTLSIRMEGGHCAAVRALYKHAPVVVYTHAGGDASALDIKLALDADGIAAIPVGDGTTRGVLLVCGDRAALADIERHGERYMTQERAAAPEPERPTAPTLDTDPWLSGRVRRATHEINNPLGIIKNYLAILKAKLGDDTSIVDELRIIHEEIDRIVRIVRALSQNDDSLGELEEESDLGLLVQDMVKVTAPSWQPRGIQIICNTSPGLPLLACDRDKLKQILLNLLLNALEATPDGGVIRLETAQVTNHKRERSIELQITDSGPGIPPELMERLFDPVESGKGGGHAGLGLSIVKTLTETLGGSISFKSGASGTTFQLLFRIG